ncbi:MAG: hypothetical protein ACI8ZM_003495 [Crocinitomix sp.]|jgi:hypothetical protein
MRKSVFIIFLLFAFIPIKGSCQDVFQKMYGSSQGDQGYAIINSSDGNFVISGSYETDGPGTSLYLLTKVTPTGDTLWVKTYGLRTDTSATLSNRHSTLGLKSYGLVECADNGYLLTGAAFEVSPHGEDDVYMVKTDSDGELLWTKAYGGVSEDYGNSIARTSDNGFIVGGVTESFDVSIRDGYVLRLDEFGDTLWTLTIGGSSLDEIKSIIETEEGDFIATGSTYSSGAGNSDVSLVKISSEGNIIWEKTYGGLDNDYGNEVLKTSTGYVIAGASLSFGFGEEDAYLISVDFDGNLLWSKSYGSDSFDGFNSIIDAIGGGYIMIGYTQSFGNLTDVLLIKTDDEGNLEWSKAYGGNGFEYGEGLLKTEDMGYLLVGYSRSFGSGSDDIYLIKIIDADQLKCNMNIPFLGEKSPETIVNTVTSTTSRNAALTIPETIVGASFINTTTECYSSLSIDNFSKSTDNSLVIYPNPSSGIIYIKSDEVGSNFSYDRVIVIDVIGQEVLRVDSIIGQKIDLSALNTGVYTAIFYDSERSVRIVKKLMISD